MTRIGQPTNRGLFDSRYVNVTGDTMTGNLTMNGGNIVMSGVETVDGIDVSVLNTTVSDHISGTGASVHGDSYVLNVGDTMTGALKINTNSATAFHVEQDGVKDDVFVVNTNAGTIMANANTTLSTGNLTLSSGNLGLTTGWIYAYNNTISCNAQRDASSSFNLSYNALTITPTENVGTYHQYYSALYEASIADSIYNVTSGTVIGIAGYARYSGSTVFPTCYGLNFVAANDGTGTVTNTIGIWTSVQNNNASGTVTNATGIEITPYVTGTTVNLKGLVVSNIISGTTVNRSIQTGRGEVYIGGYQSIWNYTATDIPLKVVGAGSQSARFMHITAAGGTANILQVDSNGMLVATRRYNNTQYSDHNTALQLWGGSSGSGSGVELRFMIFYTNDTSYPTWNMGSITGVYNSADGGWAGNLVFYVNNGSAQSQDTEAFRIRKNGIEIGSDVVGVDYTLTFRGENSDGVLTWMEDEDYFKFSDDIYMNGGENIILSSATGTKIGTATNQLLGFYNATPVDQPATVSDAATQDLTGTDTVDQTKLETDLTSCKTAINTIIDRLQELGLIA